jgi:hypothetical protein
MQQRVADAQALRRDLAQQGADVSALDRAIDAMKSMAARPDDKASAELRAQIIDGLKAYEFALRKTLGDQENGRVMSGRTGDVPPAFRAYVEEYYRAIAKPPTKP